MFRESERERERERIGIAGDRETEGLNRIEREKGRERERERERENALNKSDFTYKIQNLILFRLIAAAVCIAYKGSKCQSEK